MWRLPLAVIKQIFSNVIIWVDHSVSFWYLSPPKIFCHWRTVWSLIKVNLRVKSATMALLTQYPQQPLFLIYYILDCVLDFVCLDSLINYLLLHLLHSAVVWHFRKSSFTTFSIFSSDEVLLTPYDWSSIINHCFIDFTWLIRCCTILDQFLFRAIDLLLHLTNH